MVAGIEESEEMMQQAKTTKVVVPETVGKPTAHTREDCLSMVEELAAAGTRFKLSIEGSFSDLEISKTQLKKYIRNMRWYDYYSKMSIEIIQLGYIEEERCFDWIGKITFDNEC